MSTIMDMAPAPGGTAADINVRIATCVRALRGALDLSLDALAARCNVSRSMLSLVERGESSATAVVLEKIATGLGVPLARLFEDHGAPPSPVSHGTERASWRDPQSGYVRRNISPPGYASPIQIVEVEFPAGARVAYETAAHVPRVAQQIWMREGAIEVMIGRITHRLVEDDCLAMQLDEPVSFRNRTRRVARYVVVLASETTGAVRR